MNKLSLIALVLIISFEAKVFAAARTTTYTCPSTINVAATANSGWSYPGVSGNPLGVWPVAMAWISTSGNNPTNISIPSGQILLTCVYGSTAAGSNVQNAWQRKLVQATNCTVSSYSFICQ